MRCKNCGAQLNEGDLFCGECGAKVEPEQNNAYVTVKSDNTKTRFNPYAQNNNTGAQNVYNTPSRSDFQSAANKKSVAPQSFKSTENAAGTAAASSSKVNIKINKKVIIIVAIIFAVVAVFLVGAYIYSGYLAKKPIEMNMSDYIIDKQITDKDIENLEIPEGDGSGETAGNVDYNDEGEEFVHRYSNLSFGPAFLVTGYNKYGMVDESTLSNLVDWERFYSDLETEIHNKRGYENTSANDVLGDNAFKFQVDKTENIKNGDTVNFTVTPGSPAFRFEDITVEIKDGTHAYTVAGLEDVNAINPFEYIDVGETGANGSAQIEWSVKEGLDEKIPGTDNMKVQYKEDGVIGVVKDNHIIANISFYFENDETPSMLSNGDTFMMYCSCDDAETLENKYKVYIAQYEKAYKVDNLGDYINTNFKIPDDTLNEFKKYAISIVEDEDSEYGNVKVQSVYFVDYRDETEEDKSFNNALYVILSYDDTYELFGGGGTNTLHGFACVEYKNLIAKDNKILYTPESYLDDYDVSAQYSSEEEAFPLNSYDDVSAFNIKKL